LRRRRRVFFPVNFKLVFHEGVMTDGPSLPNLISSEFLSWKTNQQNKIRISQEVNTSLDIYIIYVSGQHVRVWDPDGSASWDRWWVPQTITAFDRTGFL
jgi:hypothetical protein